MSRYKVYDEPVTARFKTVVIKKAIKDKLEEKRQENNFKSISELIIDMLKHYERKRT